MQIGLSISPTNPPFCSAPSLLLDSISGAVAAWSTGRKLSKSYGGPIADVAGGIYSTLYDQIGARNATASGSPAQGAGTINGNSYIKLDAVNDKFAFTSLALGSGDWEAWCAIGVDASVANVGAILGRAGGTTGMRGTSSTNFDIRSDSAGPQGYGSVWVTTPGFHIYRFKRSGGNIFIDCDGEQLGSPYGRAIAGNFTFDQIGVSSASTAFSKMGLGEIIIFNRALSDQEAAVVLSDMLRAWPSALYIDATGGNDSNLGWNAATAFQTIGIVRPMIHRRNQQILLKKGETWRRDPLLFNVVNQQGAAGAPIIVGSYGTGARPLLIGSKSLAGPWTLVSGTEYKATLAMTSLQCVWVINAGVTTRLTLGTAGALANGQFAYNAGDTTVHINVGADPTGRTVEAADNDAPGTLADPNGVRAAKAFISVAGMETKHWPFDGHTFEGANCSYTDLFSHHNANDGVGGSGTSLYLGQGTASFNGQGRATSGSAGDGASLHGASDCIIEDFISLNNDKAGFDHQATATVLHRRCLSDGNNQNLLVAALAGTAGTHTYENCIFIRRAGDQIRHMQAVNQANVTLRFCTIVDMEPGVGNGFYVSSTGTVDVKNTIIDGFSIDVEYAAGTLTHDYNVLNSTTHFSSGPVLAAHELVGAPSFVDRANTNFHLNSTSIAKGAGTDLGVTTDYDRAVRSLPPDIGAFKAAA